MKHTIIILISFLIMNNIILSQPVSNLVIFSEDGYPFFVVINGIQENDEAQTNVKLKGLTAPNYKVKIIFEDKSIPTIDKNLYTKPDMEVSYRIKKNKKGEFVLNYYSEAPVPFEPINKIVVVEDQNNRSDVIVNPDITDQSGGVDVNMNIDDGVNTGGVNVNMNVNEGGISYNVQTNDGVNINADINVTDANLNYNESTYYEETIVYKEDNSAVNVYQMPGYSGPVGCNWPMDNVDFERAKNTINNADFEDDKLTIAKQIVGMNCLTVEQIKQIGLLFDFEDSRLDFAKFAYGRTFDLGNYFIINDIFEFSSSIDELNRYISSH